MKLLIQAFACLSCFGGVELTSLNLNPHYNQPHQQHHTTHREPKPINATKSCTQTPNIAIPRRSRPALTTMSATEPKLPSQTAASPRAHIIKAPLPLPSPLEPPSIFLSGFISPADDCWRDKLSAVLSHLPVTIINPLRRDWDHTWKASLGDSKFVNQVTWELNALEQTDIVVVNLGTKTEASISLMELGFVAGLQKRIVVCCADEYKNSGNVQVFCRKLGITVAKTLEELISSTERALADFVITSG